MKGVPMDLIMLKEKLIAVLGQIQADSALECPPLTGATKPIESLPKFDSKVWPVATTILAIEIGATIPPGLLRSTMSASLGCSARRQRRSMLRIRGSSSPPVSSPNSGPMTWSAYLSCWPPCVAIPLPTETIADERDAHQLQPRPSGLGNPSDAGCSGDASEGQA